MSCVVDMMGEGSSVSLAEGTHIFEGYKSRNHVLAHFLFLYLLLGIMCLFESTDSDFFFKKLDKYYFKNQNKQFNRHRRQILK